MMPHFFDRYLSSLGNDVIRRYRNEKRHHVPKKRHIRLPSFNDAEYHKILKNTDKIETENQTIMSAYAVVIFCMCGGLRAKEIQMADADNPTINDKGAELFLTHVKGKGSYGQSRSAPILPDALPFIERYMEARHMRLAACDKN